MHDPHALSGDDLVVDGIRLHVVRHGRGGDDGQPPLLLLHGLATTGRLWSDMARDVEHQHLSVIPDLAGCGRSERPAAARRGAAAQAELMLSLLSSLDAPRAVVVGHDVGGAVAVHMAALAPETVAALVLVSTPLHADVWPPAALRPWLVPGVGAAASRVVRTSHTATAQVVAAIAGGNPPCQDPAGALRGVSSLAPAYDVAAATAALDVVAATPPPTLVLWGAEDARLAPSYGARLAAGLPGSCWVPIPDAGHLLPAERPERVAEEITGFLDEVLVAATAG